MRPGFIPNDPLREAAEKAVATWATWDGLAVEIGWLRSGPKGDNRGDGTRLRRSLGVVALQGHKQTHISEAKAEKIMRVLHLDPVDVGL